MNWIDPCAGKYATPPQKLDLVCREWIGGASKKELKAIAALGTDKITRILEANFQIEWRPDRWIKSEGSLVERAAAEPFFEYLQSRKHMTREPLNGARRPECPPATVRCNLCRLEFLGNQSGCQHNSIRYYQIAKCLFGDSQRFVDPDIGSLPMPLSVPEMRFFETALQGCAARLLDELEIVMTALGSRLKLPTRLSHGT